MTRWEDTTRANEWAVGDDVWMDTVGAGTQTLYTIKDIVHDEVVLEWAIPLTFRAKDFHDR